MMARTNTIVDLSHPLREPLPCYPGDPPFKMSLACSSDLPSSLVVHVHALSLGTHTGTHIDAPFHFFPNGQKLHEIPIAQFVGHAVVVDIRPLAQERRMITWLDLVNLSSVSSALMRIGSRREGKADIVLFWTGWDERWDTPSYFAHPYFSQDVGQVLRELGVRIVGVDTLSPDETPADENAETEHGWGMHETLLRDGILICENLRGLGQLVVDDVREDLAWVSLMPLSIHDADGAPVRAYGCRGSLVHT